MKFSLKKYSSLLFVLIGIIVLYILFIVFNKKEGNTENTKLKSGQACEKDNPGQCKSGRCRTITQNKRTFYQCH